MALLAVPVAVGVWHATTRPPLPPPSGRARRALTRAAAAVTMTLAIAGTIISVTLIVRHTAGVGWWWLPVPLLSAVVPFQMARQAAGRYHAPPERAAD